MRMQAHTDKSWKTIEAETEEGVACTTGTGACSVGPPGKLKLVKPSEADLKAREKALNDGGAGALGQALRRRLRGQVERSGRQAVRPGCQGELSGVHLEVGAGADRQAWHGQALATRLSSTVELQSVCSGGDTPPTSGASPPGPAEAVDRASRVAAGCSAAFHAPWHGCCPAVRAMRGLAPGWRRRQRCGLFVNVRLLGERRHGSPIVPGRKLSRDDR